MGLLRHYLRGEIAELHRNGVRLRVIGQRAGSRPNRDADRQRREPDARQHRVAADDRAPMRRDEIALAARAVARRVAAGELDPSRSTRRASPASVDRRHPRPRPRHPHQRRAADQHFCVADRLRGVHLHRDAVPDFAKATSRARCGTIMVAIVDTALPLARIARRRGRSAARCSCASCRRGDGAGGARRRLVRPPFLSLLVVLAGAGMGWEWARLCTHGRFGGDGALIRRDRRRGRRRGSGCDGRWARPGAARRRPRRHARCWRGDAVLAAAACGSPCRASPWCGWRRTARAARPGAVGPRIVWAPISGSPSGRRSAGLAWRRG